MSYERDQFQTFVTSASLSTALAPYVTSQSVSAAIAGISLGAYVTSNSLSAAVATDALTVRGPASVSATMSAAAVTVAGRPVGSVFLGTVTGTNRTGFNFSGSWSDFGALFLQVFMFNGFGTSNVALESGGTTVLNHFGPGVISNASCYEALIMGHDGASNKMYKVTVANNASGQLFTAVTATANTTVINQINFSITGTASFIIASLYGWRKS